jgi:hypothetical protein
MIPYFGTGVLTERPLERGTRAVEMAYEALGAPWIE